MLLIRCPYCEEDLPELEFRHAGEAHIARPSNLATISDADFEAFFFIRSNPKGVVYERWRHVHGCARFFNAARDTVSDRFIVTYRAGEPRPVLPAVGAPNPAASAATVVAAPVRAPRTAGKQATGSKPAAKGKSK